MPRMTPGTRRAAVPAALAALVLGLLAAAGPAAAAVLDLAGPPGAAIRLNGVALGTLPLDPLTLGPGRYLVEGELEGYRPFAQAVLLEGDTDHARVQVRFDHLSRRTAWTSSVLYAGLGQFYLDKPTRGWIYAAVETGGLLAALAGELQRSNLRGDYLVLKDAYDTTINANEAAELRVLAAKKYADMEDAQKVRDTGLLVALAAVGVSVADALLSFPHVAAGPGPVPPTAACAPAATDLAGGTGPGFHAALTLSF